jgi:CopG family transcriptional regulator/antitoxin EndoAI
MCRRLSVTLPEETVRLLERVTPKGERSRLIDEAIRGFAEKVGRGNLRRQLREGALRRAERDLALAREWFALDEEVWQRSSR